MTEQVHELATLIKAVQDLTEKVDLNHRDTSQCLIALRDNNNAKTADPSTSSQDQQPTRHHHHDQLQQNQQFVP